MLMQIPRFTYSFSVYLYLIYRQKSGLLLAGSLALSSVSIAQQLSPSVVATSGGTIRTQTMTLDWTLGEAVVETATVSERLYTQGFHQPLLQVSEQPNRISLFGVDADYSFVVAPNPVTSHLTISITAPESSPLQVLLTDMKGVQYTFPVVPADTKSTQLDLTAFPAGMYLLHIGKTDGPRLKSYKVVKIQ